MREEEGRRGVNWGGGRERMRTAVKKDIGIIVARTRGERKGKLEKGERRGNEADRKTRQAVRGINSFF